MTIERPFKQKPDFEHLRQVIMRETADGPVPIFEMMTDGSIMGQVTGLGHTIDQMTELNEIRAFRNEESPISLEDGMKYLDLNLAFSKAVGYDSVLNFVAAPFPTTKSQYSTSAKDDTHRPWQNEHDGLIPDRAAFDAFPWPDVSEINTGTMDYIAANLPEGMKIHVAYMGVFEDLRSLMGFEPMAIKSIEEPDLLEDILERLTILSIEAVTQAAKHPAAGMVIYADDLGFKTSTMLSPAFYRKMVFPRQARIAEACHNQGKPFVFHSCGNIDRIMEDLIETVKIDAIHSFEDNIEPVEKTYEKYSDRIAILGGVDVHLLAQGSTDEVRKRCREILDFCGKKGGFAIGSGNSVTNYCKLENYYAMIDEARIWNEENGYL